MSNMIAGIYVLIVRIDRVLPHVIFVVMDSVSLKGCRGASDKVGVERRDGPRYG